MKVRTACKVVIRGLRCMFKYFHRLNSCVYKINRANQETQEVLQKWQCTMNRVSS